MVGHRGAGCLTRMSHYHRVTGITARREENNDLVTQWWSHSASTTSTRNTMATHVSPRLPSPDAMLIEPAKWPVCSRCQLPVAQFSLSDRLRCDLLKLLEKGQTNDAVRLLRSVAGCSSAFARSWVAHHGLTCFRNPLCPRCRRPLRTPSARQCRHCGTDWHPTVSA